jgi:FkbM family methyltransferase
MSTTARRYWLKLLRGVGVKHFRATSGLGLPYVCHVGDFAGEAPFYNRLHSALEISAMAAWCRDLDSPVIFDVGANNGFVSTQLAQLLRDRSPQIYAFEPVPTTFSQMVHSINSLGLDSLVTPVCCALSDSTGVCTIAFNSRESLFAQVRSDAQNPRAGDRLAVAPTMTLDKFIDAIGKKPSLIKIDVEGFEPNVVKGGAALLSGDDPPALCFEWNPLTLSEVRNSPLAMMRSLASYHLYYIDDFEGQRRPFAQEISNLGDVAWVCNVFAMPRSGPADRWSNVRTRAMQAIGSL